MMAGDELEVENLKLKVNNLETELSITKEELKASKEELERKVKDINKTQRKLDKSHSYNDDLRKQIKTLSQEIQEFRDRRRDVKHVEIQAIAEEILTAIGEKPLPKWDNDTVSSVQESDEKVPSIAESLKQTAEAALAQTGFVFDEKTGLYYDYNSGYYYNCEHGLYYEPTSGTYFYYDETSGEYTFHSQVEPQYTCPVNQVSSKGDNSDKGGKSDRRRKRAKERKEKESAVSPIKNSVDDVTEALHNLEIANRRQHALDISESWPPCIRVMVTESDCLDEGTLFIVTCDGATIGREKDMNHLVRIPDINVSKHHAEIQFDYDAGSYVVVDCGSQNGTLLNNKCITQSKNERSVRALGHGDTLQFGNTALLLHIHPGTDTCDDCEPGQVLSRIRDKQKKEVVIQSKEDRQREQRKQLKQIKKRYGLENAAYIDNTAAIHNPAYQDKAETRRREVGSDNPHVIEEAPASVMRPISTENKGRKLLAKMGWKEGQGLGKDNAGIAEPINVMLRTNQSAGLGSSAAVEKTLDDVQSVKRSQRWLQAQQRYNKIGQSGIDTSQPTNVSFSFKKGPTVNLQPKVELETMESDSGEEEKS